MIELEIKSFLNTKDIPYKENPSQIYFDCPYCGKEDKLYISKETGAWDCKVCQERGGFKRLKYLVPKPRVEKLEVKTYVPDDTVSRYQKKLVDHEKLRDYLFVTRKLDPNVVEEFKLGVNDRGDISIPYFQDGKLITIKFRNMGFEDQMAKYEEDKTEGLDPKKPTKWYSTGGSPGIYGEEFLLSKPKNVVIFEGEWDLLAARTYGITESIAIPGAQNRKDEWVDRLTDIENIYICYDNDTAGQEGAYQLAARLGLDKCKNVVLPENDLNDCLIEGISYTTVEECIKEAKAFEVDGTAKPSAFKDEAMDKLFNPDRIDGRSTGFPTVDKLMNGVKDQYLTLVSGWPQVGKTTWLHHVVHNMAQQGIPTYMISLETPVRDLINDIVKKELGDDISRSRIDRVFEDLDNLCIKYYDMREEKEPMSIGRFETFAKENRDRYGTKVFVIDDLSKLTALSRTTYSRNETAEQDAVMHKLTYIAKRLDVHLMVIHHLKKPENEAKLLKMPNTTDLKGSSGFMYIADNILFVHRNTDPTADDELRADVDIIVAKVRTGGELGVAHLRYNKNRSNYEET